MDSLEDATNEFRTKLAAGISKSGQLKKIFKEANIKCTEREREDLLRRATDHFSKNLDKRIKYLLAETNIDEKLKELQGHIQESEELNKELNLESGYRPVDPKVDVVGHLEMVQTGYSECLSSELEKLNNEIAVEKDDLKEKMKLIERLEKEINQYL